ncbi:F-box domain, cyclin-like protein [Artemisia annua]|uniref:F-box domain, cyclin-like protein n=1 Tax=Artemisia annua TaxID=35608 RepID=A0A2U1NWV0_ARTAN|nr:F-box domain, cyclin-like protein [Artemisia annua]
MKSMIYFFCIQRLLQVASASGSGSKFKSCMDLGKKRVVVMDAKNDVGGGLFENKYGNENALILSPQWFRYGPVDKENYIHRTTIVDLFTASSKTGRIGCLDDPNMLPCFRNDGYSFSTQGSLVLPLEDCFICLLLCCGFM